MNFDVIVDFLKSYYKEIIEVSILIISVVIALIRKRPLYNEIDTIKKDALDLLPSLIISVERDGHGAEKKQAVLDLLFAYLSKKYHFQKTDEMINYFSDVIENILSTPSKKGE